MPHGLNKVGPYLALVNGWLDGFSHEPSPINILIVTIIIRYGDWTDIEYAVTKTRESYGYNNAVSKNMNNISISVTIITVTIMIIIIPSSYSHCIGINISSRRPRK